MNIPGTPPPPAPPIQILYADDDSALRRLVQRVLTEAGYAVDTCENGAEAWNCLSSQHYDLLVTDNQMPELTGLELIYQLRQAGNRMPVILVSGAIGTFAGAALESLRCDAELGKPFSSPQLVALVRRVLESVQERWPEAIPRGANHMAPSHWGINE